MGTLLFILALATAWHVGLAVIERQRRPERERPSLAKLLLLTEVEVLRTLRAELKRRSWRGHKDRCERKLSLVEERLEELKGDEAKADS